MQTRVTHISTLQAGKVLAAIYALVAIVLLPISVLGVVFSRQPGGYLSLIGLVLYPVLGFVFGAIMAAVYNFVVRFQFVGGLEVTLQQPDAES